MGKPKKICPSISDKAWIIEETVFYYPWIQVTVSNYPFSKPLQDLSCMDDLWMRLCKHGKVLHCITM